MKNVAVIGFGFMGITHSLNILRIPGLNLKAIVDRNPDMIEKNLLDDCLKSEDLDAVNICTHVNLHYEMTKKALQQDKHVFLEKPFCLDIKQAEELVALAYKRNKILMIGHVVRFMSPYLKLKKWIDTREFGKLKFLALSRFCGIPLWGQWKEKDIREQSGGALFDLVIHDIDFANHILGVPDKIESRWLPGDYTGQDYVSALWNYYSSGVHVRIEGGFTFHAAFPFQASYMAEFENASILYTTFRGDVIHIADNDKVKEVPANDEGDGYFNEIAYFAGCIENNTRPHICPPESSLQAIELCYKHLND
jgi:predicted dehydrogenase